MINNLEVQTVNMGNYCYCCSNCHQLPV